MAKPDENECTEAKKGVTDVARSIFGTLLAAAAVVAAVTNAQRAISIAEQEYELAKKYWQIAENWLNYYRDYYVPVENQEVAEARAIPITEPEYDVARGRARATALIQTKGVAFKAIRNTSRYATGARQAIIAETITAQAAAVAMAEGLGYRNERAYVETRNDVRFKKMLETAKRGRNMMANNASFAELAAGIYGNMVDQAWAGLVGAGQFLGYELNRREPVYPQTMVATRMGQEERLPGDEYGVNPISVETYAPFGEFEQPSQIQERTL